VRFTVPGLAFAGTVKPKTDLVRDLVFGPDRTGWLQTYQNVRKLLADSYVEECALAVTNPIGGIALSADGKWLYFTDNAAGELKRASTSTFCDGGVPEVIGTANAPWS